jgi:hypothetical protein
MSNKPRLKYEKPISIDMGRVAPILGDTCSVGNGAADCPSGMNNATVAICEPSGSGADNDCRTGSNAGTFCWPTGSGAAVYCLAGSGFGTTSSLGTDAYDTESSGMNVIEEPTSSELSGGEETFAPEPDGYEYPAPPPE